MLIDDRYKFVMQHIPKTGGTFLTHFAERYIPTSYQLTTSCIKWCIRPEEQEWCYNYKLPVRHAVLGHMEFRKMTQEIIESYKLLMLIREPVELWVSRYIAVEHPEQTMNYKYVAQPKVNQHRRTFKEFMEDLTLNFDPLQSYSRKIENAVSVAKPHMGHIYIRTETLGQGAINAFSKMGVEVTEVMKDHLLHSNAMKRDSKVGFKTKLLNQLETENPCFLDKIRDYESFLMDVV